MVCHLIYGTDTCECSPGLNYEGRKHVHSLGPVSAEMHNTFPDAHVPPHL